MSQSKAIAVCYFFVVGIALALLVPVDSSYLSAINVAAFALFVCAAIFAVLRAGRGRIKEAKTRQRIGVCEWACLLVAIALLGYARYISADTIPDTRLGTIDLAAESTTFQPQSELPDMARLIIRKIEPLDVDVKLRVSGQIDARLPVESEDGVPTLDEQGRWRFRLHKLQQESDEIVISRNDPVGTEYLIPQPFTKVDDVKIIEGPSSGRLAVYRVSNHIASFVRGSRGTTPVTVLGRVAQDPWVKGFQTVLHITPAYIQYRPEGPFYKVDGQGIVRVFLKPEIKGYDEFARSQAYGYDVVVKSELFHGRAMKNPGGFDQLRMLQNHNVYGLMFPYQSMDGPPPIVAVSAGEQGLRKGHGLVEFSLDLRDNMLRVIKQTMPYPNSAMLGAVTLGLRYGLQGTTCYFNSEYGKPLFGRHCDMLVSEEFRHSGVNHVLAVSGLHVTIIMLLFMGIFSLLRVPKRAYAPFVVLALVMFAIITGARPSTLRAVIMNSLFVLTTAYLNRGLASSVHLALPVAAFLILIHNPLMIVDPSLTLSFGAILSLVLVSDPVYQILTRFRGNNFLVLLVLISCLFTFTILRWPLLLTMRFWLPFAFVAALLFWLSRRLTARGIRLIGNVGFINIPKGVGMFLAMQVAIQIGMMVPLSAAYFCRWAVGGAFANLLALPLIGVVIQIGILAGLVGQLPLIGGILALVMNGANWVFSTAFLWLAHFSSEIFPWTFVRKIMPLNLAFYYILLAVFVWHAALWSHAKRLWSGSKNGRRVVVASCLALVFVISAWAYTRPRYSHPGGLNVMVLAVDYGSAVLLETPGGKKILVDAGYVQHDRGRFNTAEKIILPHLSYRGIRKLDGLIITSPMLERSAGAASILKHCKVKDFFSSYQLSNLKLEMTRAEFAEQLSLPARKEYVGSMYEELVARASVPGQISLVKELNARKPDLLNRWGNCFTKAHEVAAGDILFEETVGGKSFRIEVLSPSEVAVDSDFPLENGSLVLRVVYDEFAMLISGNLHFAGQKALVQAFPNGELLANVMIPPHHGTALPGNRGGFSKGDLEAELYGVSKELLAHVSPDLVVFDYGNPGPVLKRETRTARRAHEVTYRFYQDQLGKQSCLSTDRDLAVMIHSDGSSYDVKTQAELLLKAGGADAISDMEIGF